MVALILQGAIAEPLAPAVMVGSVELQYRVRHPPTTDTTGWEVFNPVLEPGSILTGVSVAAIAGGVGGRALYRLRQGQAYEVGALVQRGYPCFVLSSLRGTPAPGSEADKQGVLVSQHFWEQCSSTTLFTPQAALGDHVELLFQGGSICRLEVTDPVPGPAAVVVRSGGEHLQLAYGGQIWQVTRHIEGVYFFDNPTTPLPATMQTILEGYAVQTGVVNRPLPALEQVEAKH